MKGREEYKRKRMKDREEKRNGTKGAETFGQSDL